MLRSNSKGIAVILLTVVMTMMAAGAEATPQSESGSSTLADWGYILRGVLFIFASAMAMVWIGRRLSKRRK